MIGLHRGLLELLAQEMEPTERGGTRLVRIDLDAVADGVGRPEADDRACGETLLAHDPLQQAEGIGVEPRRLAADHGILQDIRVPAVQFPRAEEWTPVDQGRDFREGHWIKGLRAEELRPGNVHLRPVRGGGAGTGGREWQRGPLALASLELGAELGLLAGDLCEVGGALLWREQRAHHVHHPRSVQHVDHARRIGGGDLHRRVRRARGGPADQQWHPETLAGHLPGHVHHLIKRGGDQARESDDVRLALSRHREDSLRRHHHAEIRDLVIVAGQHHAHDILPDVVDVALDRREHDAALGRGQSGRRLLRLHIRCQHGHGLLHHAGGLHHLGEEHLACAEEVSDHPHPVHQRTLDDVERPRVESPRLLGVRLDEGVDALDQRVAQALGDRGAPPLLRFGCRFARGVPRGGLLQLVGQRHEPFRGVRTAVEDHVLDPVPEFHGNLLVDAQHPGVHDRHIQARLHGVVQEHRVHRLADRVVAAEGEGDVRNAAAHARSGKSRLDGLGSFEEVYGVSVVLLDASRHREDVRIEDDVLCGESDGLRQKVVGSRADTHLLVARGRLPLLVERHHHHGRAVAPDQPRPAQELRLPVLQGDGVHDALALQALQSALQYGPLGGVEHHRHARDLGLGGDQVEKSDHRRLPVDQRLVDVDVDHVGPALHLLPGDGEAGLPVARLERLGEAGRTGDVGPLPND